MLSRTLFWSFLLSLGISTAAFPCSCGPLSFDKAFGLAGTVFTGQVSSLKKGTQAYSLVARLRVQKVFKGDVTAGSSTRLVTADSSAACGVTFQVGQSYLVWAGHLPTGEMETNLCTLTKPLADAAADLAWLAQSR